MCYKVIYYFLGETGGTNMKVYEVPAQADDELQKKIADLLMQQMTRTHTEETYQTLLNGIQQSLQEGSLSKIAIAEEQGTVLGLAFFNIGISLKKGGKYIWLNDLFVHNEHRNRGIAKKILLHVIHWAENEGLKGIELETGINNSVTKHLYNSLGFHDIISKRYGFTF
jgi:GNAT superfamily N-acetyltransferase